MKKEFSNYFDWVYEKKPSLSAFNLSHDFKFSCDAGFLIPVFCKELVPGDAFKVRTGAFCRLAPMIAPVMHEVQLKTNWFFVPNRLIWDEWEDFITPGVEVEDLPPVAPFMPPIESSVGSLANYLGIPLRTTSSADKISALPFRAYAKIWNDWYRDENLQEEVPLSTASGSDTTTLDVLLRRDWEKDLFTAATPRPLRGEDVVIPITGTGHLEFVNNSVSNKSTKLVSPPGFESIQEGNDLQAGAVIPQSDDHLVQVTQYSPDTHTQAYYPVNIDVSGNHLVRVTSTSVTVSQLRTAEKIQEWFEKQMRGGTRYIEQIKAHFGVTSPDARLQRSEYIGGSSQVIVMDEVMNNTSSQDSAPLGDYAGKGTSWQTSKYHRFFSTEHGFLICLMSIMPRTGYMQGLDPMWYRHDKFDYFWPLFEHLGDAAIPNKQIYYNPSDGKDDETFGYNERYADYKYYPNRVAGEFADNLTFFHLARKFDNRPALNAGFVECHPRTDIFAVETDVHHYYCDIFFDVTAVRPMKHHPVPTL